MLLLLLLLSLSLSLVCVRIYIVCERVCRELKVALRALGFAVKKAEVRALMHEYDRAGAGKIDAEEFKDIGTHAAHTYVFGLCVFRNYDVASWDAVVCARASRRAMRHSRRRLLTHMMIVCVYIYFGCDVWTMCMWSICLLSQ